MSEEVTSGYKQELKRTLSFTDVLIYGIVFVVPIAPVCVFGYTYQASSGMVPLVYLIGAISMFFTAYAYSHLSKEFHVSGSMYSYVQRGLNPHIGFITGWTLMLDYVLMPALNYVFSIVWIVDMMPTGSILANPWIWAVSLIFLATVLNVVGVESAAKAGIVLVIVQSIALALFIGIGAYYIHIHGGGFTVHPFYQPKVITFTFLTTAASIAALSYLGFDAISTLAEETTGGVNTISKATMACLAIVATLFISQTYIASLIAPAVTNFDPDVAAYQCAGIAGGAWLRAVVEVVGIIGMLGCCLESQLAVSRILYSMARDKTIPTFLGRVHPKYKTPYAASIFIGVISLILLIIVKLDPNTLVTFVNFGALSSFIVLNFTVLWYFYIRKKMRSFISTIKYLVCPICGILILGYIWSGFSNITLIVGFTWLGSGIVFGAIKSKGYKEVPEVFKNVQI